MLKSTLIEVWNRKWRISAEVKDQLSFLPSAATFTLAHSVVLLRAAVVSEVTARIRPRRSSFRVSGVRDVSDVTAAVGGREVASDRKNKMNIQARRIWIHPAGSVSLLLSIISVEAVAPALGALAALTAVLYYL